MRRILSLTLTLLLLLAACAPAQPATSQAALSADEVPGQCWPPAGRTRRG